jgi:lysophospholipase L1-like esterase
VRRRSIMTAARSATAFVVVALVVAGCSSSSDTTAPSAEPTTSVETTTVETTPDTETTAGGENAVHLVVIGDSIPFAAFCSGCTGFVDQYSDELEARTGRPVTVANRSRDDSAGLTEIKQQVAEDGALRDEIAAADVVLVSVGFNNALPSSGILACSGSSGAGAAGYIDWALSEGTPKCVQAGVDWFARDYDTIFSTITDLLKGKPTLVAALNLHAGNLSGGDFAGVDVPQKTRDRFDRWLVDASRRWNAMLCAQAKSHGVACVDVYHAFNGPTGDVPSGANTVDGAHPSQAGNDLIAGLLAKLDTSAATG